MPSRRFVPIPPNSAAESDRGEGLPGPHRQQAHGAHQRHASLSIDKCVSLSRTAASVRNPWGEAEWKGPWSDGSKEWTPALRKELKHEVRCALVLGVAALDCPAKDRDDGVFWMDMDDFFSEFNRFSVVRMYSHRFRFRSVAVALLRFASLNPVVCGGLGCCSLFDHKWHSFHFVGEWDEFSAGGCMNNQDTWNKNPQVFC